MNRIDFVYLSTVSRYKQNKDHHHFMKYCSIESITISFSNVSNLPIKYF